MSAYVVLLRLPSLMITLGSTTLCPCSRPGDYGGCVIARTPEPPYTAVIFTSVRTPDDSGYDEATAQMVALAAEQPGFLGLESARAAIGITVSYWENDESARAWKRVAEHAAIQRRGRSEWYAAYQVRVATVTRDYGHESGSVAGEVVLTTERLTLRRFTTADVDLLVHLDSDPAVMRFITGGRPSSREEIELEVLPCWLGHYAIYDHYGFFAALDRSTGDFLGWFHLRPASTSAPDEPELGYRLRRSAWGRGYATEGSRALVDAAFAEYGARRVFAETMAVNTASRRVMEKAGLHLVRTFFADWPDKIDGDEEGDVEYAVTREQWAAAQAAVQLDQPR